jgi:hypothetical protein
MLNIDQVIYDINVQVRLNGQSDLNLLPVTKDC